MNQAYLILSQAAEQRQDLAAANAWLDRVENQDEVLAAQVRRASLLARQNRMADARALLRKWPERRPEDLRLKLVAEAQLLREFKQFDAALAVYQEAMQRLPDDTDLMYEAAMAAERAERLDEMERLLRRVIALNPEQAHAYNALGYSLADRNLRLPEARQLIEKAVALAPNDAYIRDSLGWVAFREGKLPQARELLESAYRQQPDAEIAAHLGEVLWVMGQQAEARRIWREGLLLASDNDTLLSTLKRLNVQP
jgi:Flp pilus assembly protein TadD